MTCLLDILGMISYCFLELGLGLIKPWGNPARQNSLTCMQKGKAWSGKLMK